MTDQAVTTKVVLIIEYEGTRYHGFQLQGKKPTIQKELESALLKLTGNNIRVATASRTDAGVHAQAQVVSFRTISGLKEETYVRALNYYLPDDIAVKFAYRVRDTFDVRRQAVSREYEYLILNSQTRSPLRDRFCYQVSGPLDVDAMSEAGNCLVGVHDFASFVNNREAAMKSTTRIMYRFDVRREKDLVVFSIMANSFLMHQVRNTVGSLIRLGRGKISREDFKNILEVKEPGKAWPTAPARGLSLIRVNYKNPIGEEK